MEYTTEESSSKMLSKPLLGDEVLDDTEVSYDDDDIVEISVRQVEEENEEEDFCDVHATTCCDNFILWLVLPLLLFVQFGIAFRLDQQQAAMSSDANAAAAHHHYYAIHNLEWSTVNYSIVLFVLSSYLFRRTLQETCNCSAVNETNLLTSTVGFLLPEIIMDLLLALVLFGQVAPAFLTMVLCTMGLSLYVVVQSFQTLVCHQDDDEEEEEEELV